MDKMDISASVPAKSGSQQNDPSADAVQSLSARSASVEPQVVALICNLLSLANIKQTPKLQDSVSISGWCPIATLLDVDPTFQLFSYSPTDLVELLERGAYSQLELSSDKTAIRMKVSRRLPPAILSGWADRSCRDESLSLFVANLHERVNELILYELFLQVGPVISVYIPRDKAVNSHKGYAFVEYGDERCLDYACACMDGIPLFEKPLRVRKTELAQKRSQQRASAAASTEHALFVAGLDPSVDEAILSQVFSYYGQITAIKIMRDEQDQSKGFGFVSYASIEECMQAIQGTNNRYICNRKLEVRISNRTLQLQESAVKSSQTAAQTPTKSPSLPPPAPSSHTQATTPTSSHPLQSPADEDIILVSTPSKSGTLAATSNSHSVSAASPHSSRPSRSFDIRPFPYAAANATAASPLHQQQGQLSPSIDSEWGRFQPPVSPYQRAVSDTSRDAWAQAPIYPPGTDPYSRPVADHKRHVPTDVYSHDHNGQKRLRVEGGYRHRDMYQMPPPPSIRHSLLPAPLPTYGYDPTLARSHYHPQQSEPLLPYPPPARPAPFYGSPLNHQWQTWPDHHNPSHPVSRYERSP